jgi:hypothetical protein
MPPRNWSFEARNRLFYLVGKIFKELTSDERSKPMVRRKLKGQKWKGQRGLCAICGTVLPEKYAVLDRLNAQMVTLKKTPVSFTMSVRLKTRDRRSMRNPPANRTVQHNCCWLPRRFAHRLPVTG